MWFPRGSQNRDYGHSNLSLFTLRFPGFQQASCDNFSPRASLWPWGTKRHLWWCCSRKHCCAQSHHHEAVLDTEEAALGCLALAVLGCALLPLAGFQQAAAHSSAGSKTSLTQLCKSLPLFSRIHTAIYWAPLLLYFILGATIQCTRKTAESRHFYLVDSSHLLQANRWQITRTQKSCNLTLASDVPVWLAAQWRRKKCLLKKVKRWKECWTISDISCEQMED